MSAAPVDIPSPGKGWKQNTGHQPRGSSGKRMRVILAHGAEGKYDDNPMSPRGWGCDSRGGTNPWSFKGTPFDIAWYLIL